MIHGSKNGIDKNKTGHTGGLEVTVVIFLLRKELNKL